MHTAAIQIPRGPSYQGIKQGMEVIPSKGTAPESFVLITEGDDAPRDVLYWKIVLDTTERTAPPFIAIHFISAL